MAVSEIIDFVFSLKEIFRIKLPGPAKLGEGKPENQNHALIFTRGEALQTIDMNQVKYIIEALSN
jgi:callose synthase